MKPMLQIVASGDDTEHETPEEAAVSDEITEWAWLHAGPDPTPEAWEQCEREARARRSVMTPDELAANDAERRAELELGRPRWDAYWSEHCRAVAALMGLDMPNPTWDDIKDAVARDQARRQAMDPDVLMAETMEMLREGLEQEDSL